jgi:signal transduction histidine kinase/CheY-like chemotaxis protein
MNPPVDASAGQANAPWLSRHGNFLLGLSDATRRLSDADAILAITLERLGRQIGIDRVGYIESHPGNTGYSVRREWCDEAIPTFVGEHAGSGTSPHLLEAMKRGEPMVFPDLLADPTIGPTAQTLLASGARAMMCVPLLKNDELAGALGLANTEPFDWSSADLMLVREVLERTWETLERARAEAALKESEALLQAFLQHAPVAMSLTDEAGELLLANEELLKRLQQNDAAMQAQSAANEASLRAEVLASGRAVERELSIVGAEAYREYLAVRFPVHTSPGAPVRIGGCYIDLTRQKAIEAELARSRDALFQSEKLTALGALLAGVSHELNNPLSVVVGQSLILEEKADDPTIAARAAKIRKAAERCARIVQTFLAMARERPPERQPIDINHLIDAALEITSYGLRAANVTVRRALAPDLPSVIGDASQLHQLLANLIINAQHAMEGHSGPRELHITTRRSPGGITIDIADTGPGIPEDQRNRVFEPFFTTRPIGAGTGLGLSFAYNVAAAHGGTLGLAPSKQGARFVLELPQGEAGEALVAQAPASPPPKGRALIVDDETELAETLAELLTERGWHTHVATSGAAAIAALERHDFDVVLSDVRMPQIDGPALYSWIKTHRPHLAPSTGFLTGDTLGSQVSDFLREAGLPFAEKPFSSASIEQLLACLLDGTAAPQP